MFRGVAVASPQEAEPGRADSVSPTPNTAAFPPRDYLTVPEAAARLGMTVAALKKRLGRGARREGRRIVCTVIGDTVTAVKLGTGPRATWRVHFEADR